MTLMSRRRFRSSCVAGILSILVSVLLPTSATASVITIQPVQFETGIQNLSPQTAAIDVSCASSGNCVSVGYVFNVDNEYVHYAQVERNGVWGLAQELGLPGQASPSGDEGPFVSCTGDLDCAVIASTSSGTYVTRYTDGQWNRATRFSSTPGMASYVSARGLKCSAPGECLAVAVTSDNRTTDHIITFQQSSGVWAAPEVLELPAPENITPIVIVRGVTCISVGACVVIGTYVDTLTASGTLGGGFIAEETSGTWSTVIDTGTFAPEGISCASSSECAAVGTQDGTFHPEAATMTKAAGFWSSASLVTFAEGTQARRPASALNDVACPAVGACTAVGYFADRVGARIALSVTLSDGVWSTAVPIRFDASATASQPNQGLGLVNCSDPSSCTAVGLLMDPENRQVGFSTSMVNGVWGPPQILGRAADAGGSLQFSIPRSMACSGATSCVMVGDQQSSGGSLGFIYDIGFAPRQLSFRTASAIRTSTPLRIILNVKGSPKPTITAATSLPTGLHLSRGAITGTLEQRGTYSFRIKAKNRWGSITRTVTITVS